MMPKPTQDRTGLLIFLIFGAALVCVGFQFAFLTSNVYVNSWIALVLALISWVSVAFWLPESPHFLYSRKRFEEARDVIFTIARVNGTASLFDSNFHLEVTAASIAENQTSNLSIHNNSKSFDLSIISEINKSHFL